MIKKYGFLFSLILCIGIGLANAQSEKPQGWKISNQTTKAKYAIDDDGTLVLSGEVGDTTLYFSSQPMSLRPNTAYAINFKSMGNTSGGSIISGTRAINSDIRQIGGQWNDCEVLFATTSNPSSAEKSIKLGGWRTNSELKFKDITVSEYLPLISGTDIDIGAQESVNNGVYKFTSNWMQLGNSAYPFAETTNSPFFNTNRWSLTHNASIAYPFGVKGTKQISGDVAFSICYNPQKISVEIFVSADSKDFESIGVFPTSAKVKIPEKFFPAEKIKIKFVGKSNSKNGMLQIDSLEYKASLDSKEIKAQGKILGAAYVPVSDKILVDRSSFAPNSKELFLNINSQTSEQISLQINANPIDGNAFKKTLKLNIKAGDNSVKISLPYKLKNLENLSVKIDEQNWQLNYKSRNANFGLIRRDLAGKKLESQIPNLILWQSSTANKLAKECATPKKSASAIKMQAAANELESAQIAFKANDKNLSINLCASNLILDENHKIDSNNIEFFTAEYVPVSTVTDKWGEVGEWPDPLPSLKSNSLKLSSGNVQPVWITITVPKGTKAGVYKGSLSIKCDEQTSQIPIEFEVFDFTLPDTTTVRSAFGDYTYSLTKYYRNPSKVSNSIKKQVRQKLARARISPYAREDTRPKYKLEFPNNDKSKTPKVVFDWTSFDAVAEELININKVNALVLNIEGIGGGTFHERHKARISSIPEDDPRYEAVMADYLGQINDHIVKKGWQNIFYTYTFDEPEKKDYPFVKNELLKIKRLAPDLRVMLTESPEEELFGTTDIWCMLSNEFSQSLCSNRPSKGEEIWWYLCTQPRAPYAGPFIDHPGIDLRMWLWQSFRYNVTGILIWATTYTHSSTAYPDELQNPYNDPMSWASGYGLAKGTKTSWGNGDGRFFYPPISYKDAILAEDDAEIVGCIRLEILREGIEDYEYLSMLKSLFAKKKHLLNANKVAEYESLLNIPETIIKSMTSYSFDASLLEIHRIKVAKAIEELQRL